ncbi:hypothetical protein INS49_013207 [Diaporthe citri]|uniref:uncharacterized protein n=1 Tax=Diaporthe citri TaxID=83186 RepID=UPI001C81C517|nr:uncharacterized protein INS49_013207 [Diaporthe citri]KAG6359684.1 hypothetical protein INS49_013207 [Diaporthe citri]
MPFGEFLAAGDHEVGVLIELQVIFLTLASQHCHFTFRGAAANTCDLGNLAMAPYDYELPFGV